MHANNASLYHKIIIGIISVEKNPALNMTIFFIKQDRFNNFIETTVNKMSIAAIVARL